MQAIQSAENLLVLVGQPDGDERDHEPNGRPNRLTNLNA